MTISHITEILSPDDIMTATFEFTLKNHSRTHRTLMCLPLLPYMVTPITKWTSPLNSHQNPLQNIYNTYVFATIAIYGHSDHKTDIIIEFTSKNQSRTYITLMGLPLLPYMVTPITKRTSPLNSHQKTALEHIKHLCVCRYCHIWSLRSQSGHHH